MLRPIALLASLTLLATPLQAGELELHHTRLANGLDVLVVEKHNAPLVTIEVAVKTGSFTETPATNGLSHLYEHMFFKGNAALPTQKAYMDRVRELGISFNGTTSTERVNYFFTLPSRNFAPGMKFMADALLSPLFNNEEIKAEREVVIGEYDRNEATPTYFLYRGLREHLYGDQAYRKNPLGERKVILSATQQTMRAFRAKFYVPNNSCLLIVGDVNKTEARVLAERLFGPRRWKRGVNPHRIPREPLPRLARTKTFVTVRNTPQVVLGASWPGPDVGRDERATFVADVWGTLLGLPHGRFQRAFRDSGLASQVSLGYYTQREGGEISFNGVVRDGKLTQVRDTLLAEIAAMAEPGYWSLKDLKLAQRTLEIGRAYESESGANLSHTLSFWWASSSLRYYKRYLRETKSVTLDQLRAFTRNYLLGRPMVLGALCNAKNKAALKLSPESLRPKARAGSAAASAVESFKLSNGVRVLFRREAGAAVSGLQVCFDGGSLDLSEATQGVDKLLLGAILDGSTSTSRSALQAKLVGLGARTSSDASYDFASLSLAAPRAGFAEAIGLLAECLKSPRLAVEHVAQRKSGLLAALNAEKADPDAYVARVCNEVFFAGHPYRLRPDGTPSSLAALTPAILRQRLAQLLLSGRVLIVIVGDHEARALRKLLEGAFGFVPQGVWTRRQPPAYAPRALLRTDLRKVPTNYVLAKAPVPALGHPDYPAARLALSVLRKRMWETLRTKHHLTYAAWAGVSRFRANYGALYVTTTKPKKAIGLTFAAIRDLQTRLVDPAALRGLIAQEETGAYSRSEAALSHAQGLAHAELVGGSWRGHYELPLALGRVTPKDVRRAAQDYLKNFRFGIIGPTQLSDDDVRFTGGEE
jgi:zinc protease